KEVVKEDQRRDALRLSEEPTGNALADCAARPPSRPKPVV
ncbi:MAG: hypothetical protein ACI9SE_003303, partial [Neolewinella sp.]